MNPQECVWEIRYRMRPPVLGSSFLHLFAVDSLDVLKQKWSNEKIHLENARKLRGIYFIDPEDEEFKETIKNARKKMETSIAPAMPCKTSKKSKCGETLSKTERIHQFGSKVLPGIDPQLCIVRGVTLERRHVGRRR